MTQHTRLELHFIQLLSVIGLLIALYLWLYHEQLITSSCAAGGFFDCSKVSGPTSPYSSIGNISIASIGLAGYATIFGLTWVRPFVPILNRPKWTEWVLLALIGGGFAFTLYLKGLELFVIEAICEYCLYSAIVMAIMFVLAISAVWRPSQNR